jgi:cell division initiation protein
MRITPLDIIQKEFNPAKRGRGFEPDEVSAFLEEVRETLEDLLRENQRLKDQIAGRDREISELRAREAEIQETLMLARSMTEELKGTARREADLLVGEAHLEAQRIVSSAHDEHRDLLQEVIRLRGRRNRLLAELRAVVESHRGLLDELEQSFNEAPGG